MDPRHLRTFLVVCRANSISAAARQLNISQPSVSVAISQLERALGGQLFERGRSGVKLTALGMAVRQRAETLENLLAATQKEAHLIKHRIAGPLVIGGTPGALASLVPKAIALLEREAPRFEMQILERPDPVLMELLRAEQIEAAVVTTGIDPLPEDLEEEDVLRDPFALIVGRRNKQLGASVRLRDLSEMRWVLPEAEGAFHRQVDALATETPTPANVIRCDSLLTTKALVSDTDYVTILPRQVATPELAKGSLRAIDIEDADFMRRVGVRRLANRPLSPLLAAFLRALREAHSAD